MTTFIHDGCSVPKWVQNMFTEITYWMRVFKPACYMHDLDHATRGIGRWKANRNFKNRMRALAYKNVGLEGKHLSTGEGWDLYMQGMKWASRMYWAVMVFGTWDWYVVKPIKNARFW